MKDTLAEENNLVQALLTMDETTVKCIISNTYKLDPTFQQTSNLITNAFKEINTSWENDFISLSQVYLTALVCEKVIDKVVLKNTVPCEQNKNIGIAVLLDYHLLGKKIICSTLRANGLSVLDLGAGLSIKEIVSAVKEHKIDILLISVLMLASALKIKELQEALSEINVKLIVGGAPFRLDPNLAHKVGVQFWCKNAGDALTYVMQLLNKN